MIPIDNEINQLLKRVEHLRRIKEIVPDVSKGVNFTGNPIYYARSVNESADNFQIFSEKDDRGGESIRASASIVIQTAISEQIIFADPFSVSVGYNKYGRLQVYDYEKVIKNNKLPEELLLTIDRFIKNKLIDKNTIISNMDELHNQRKFTKFLMLK